jgi:hypothetical protein
MKLVRSIAHFDFIMKRVILISAMTNVLMTAHGQGTVVFANVYTGGIPNAPVYESDGVTKLSGSQFMAELFAGPSVSSLAAIAMTGFATGSQAGYFFGGEQTINSVPGGGTAWVQVDVWNTGSGATFPQAQASGLPDSWWQSPLFTAQTGNPFGTPLPPQPLTGLGTFPVFLNAVPEPSTFALAVLGAVVVFRRKRLRR